MASDLASIRRDLADIRSKLRTAQDYYHSAKLRAELALIDKVGGDPKNIGSNEVDRKRAYDIACEGDEDCRMGLENVRALQHQVAVFEAELDIVLDQRHEDDIDLRRRGIELREAALMDANP